MASAPAKPGLLGITTWNVWGVPFASELIFHRAKKWRSFHDQQLQRLLAQKQLSADSGLVVCCFQEVWSFPKGPLMEYTASLDESRTSARWEGFVLVLGILFRAFACGRIWDAAQRLFDVPSDEAEAAKARINYAAVVGNRGMSLPCRALVDSGLCIFATKEPSDQGFFPYTSYPSGLHEERLANKGLMWAFWKSDASGVLVLNTHLSTEAVQTEQLEQLRRCFEMLRDKFRVSCPGLLEIYVCGDFNMGDRVSALSNFCQQLGLERLTGAEPNAWLSFSLDHVFGWRSDGCGFAGRACEAAKPWTGDGGCRGRREDISDHPWQGVVMA